MRWVLLGGPILVGCARMTSGDPATTDSLSESSALGQGTSFSCGSHAGPADRVRVTLRDGAQRLIGVLDSDMPLDLGTTTAVYLVEAAPTTAHPERVRITLETLTPGVRVLELQNAWQPAVTQGWVYLRAPFVLERDRAGGWRASGPNKGASTDSRRQEFFQSVGNTVDLLRATDLATSIDGHDNDGNLSVPLPASVSTKMGLSNPPASASTTGPGYPATFAIAMQQDREVEPTLPLPPTADPPPKLTAHTELEVTFTVDQRCHVLELTRTDTSALRIPSPFISGLGTTRRVHWGFTPLGS